MVNQIGHSIEPGSTKAVTSLRDSKPKNVGEVRKLTGLFSYYRRYNQHFSRIAKPFMIFSRNLNERGSHCRKVRGEDESQPSRRNKCRPMSQSTGQVTIMQHWSN